MTRQEKVNSIHRSPYAINVSKVYYKHAVVYGDYCDVRTYKDVKITFKNAQNRDYSKRESGNKRGDSIGRSRNQIYRLVQSNVGQHGKFKPVFATYTFKEPVQDIDTANRTYKHFIQRLNYYTGSKLKYIVVPEIQTKRQKKYGHAVWHFHTVFFNLPFIDARHHEKIWSHGHCDISIAKNVGDVGAYLSKYLTKDILNSRAYNKKIYYASRGLVRPFDVFHTDAIDKLVKSSTLILGHFEGPNYSQTKYKLSCPKLIHSLNPHKESTRVTLTTTSPSLTGYDLQ